MAQKKSFVQRAAVAANDALKFLNFAGLSHFLDKLKAWIEATFAKKEDIAHVYRPKGSCTWAELIAKTDSKVGDVWNVTDKGGMNYVCIDESKLPGAEAWDAIGGEIDLSEYAKKTELEAHAKLGLGSGATASDARHASDAEKTAWSAKYDKPSTGIPKTDLETDVQTSLGKADTALQEDSLTPITNEEIDALFA